MIYLDSCILIYRLEGVPGQAEAIARAMRASAGVVFCISNLVRMECLVGPIRDGDEQRRAGFEAHFRKLRRLTLTKAVFDLAAELRALHRLKTPDALHAAAAIHHGCEEIWTGDRRFAVLADRFKIRAFEDSEP